MGKIIVEEINVTCSDEIRKLRIYLPDSYEIEKEKEYPVIYMQDGQNVFTNETATYGYAWQVKNILENYEKKGKECIVVALDCSEENRYNEYSPWVCEKPKSDFEEGKIYGGNGKRYGEFFNDTLKSNIEKKYRVTKNREKCAIAGSSMGGFISAYICEKYPEEYGVAGIFSIASWFAEKAFLESKAKDNNQKIFIYVGTEEFSDKKNPVMNQTYIDNTINYYNKILGTGINLKNIKISIRAGEEHCEKAWEKAFSEFLKFFFETMK